MSLFTKLFVSFLFSVLFSSASADQVFYCVDERVVATYADGFGRINASRFTLSFSDDWSSAIVKIGSNHNLECEKPIPYIQADLFSCRDQTMVFFIDRITKRYTFSNVSPYSYIYDGSDTSDISDGVCENF